MGQLKIGASFFLVSVASSARADAVGPHDEDPVPQPVRPWARFNGTNNGPFEVRLKALVFAAPVEKEEERHDRNETDHAEQIILQVPRGMFAMGFRQKPWIESWAHSQASACLILFTNRTPKITSAISWYALSARRRRSAD